ncbi:MAG: hypothetical protein ACTHK8_02105 [Ginsengibacter sp.]
MEITANTQPEPIKKKKLKLPRTLGAKQFLEKKFVELPFEGRYKDSFGLPEDNFSMIIWGQSGNGKTEAEVIICKELTKYGKVYFNSTEQGISRSLQTSWERNNMHEVDGMIQIAHKEDYETMVVRLKRRKSAKVVFIDSVQHSKITYEMWCDMRAMFPKKIFVLISHAKGSEPSGAAAFNIRYDVDIKCYVKDFVLYPDSRFGGGKAFIIYEEGYRRKMARKTGKKPNQIKLPQ